MKLKRLVEDFRVTEQIGLPLAAGRFALYRLTKQSLGTPEAIDAIARRWNVPRGQIAFAGLKDKHALTEQFLTIPSGPRRGLSQANLTLDYVGQTERPIHASDITANHFQVVVRDLSEAELSAARHVLGAIRHNGLPNYFDDQRFGSVGPSGEFIARPWCLGDYERALWLALAEPNIHDRPEEQQRKAELREHWGNWARCQRRPDRWRFANVITFLNEHPADFRRAIAMVRQDLRSIWLAAYQSHIWNQVLSRCMRQVCQPSQCSSRLIGGRDVLFFYHLDDAQAEQLRGISLPLPSARIRLQNHPQKQLYDEALATEGIELRQLRVKYPRDSFFSKGERQAVFQPATLSDVASHDELYPGRQKLTLDFSLPRSAYATIVVKQICPQAAGD